MKRIILFVIVIGLVSCGPGATEPAPIGDDCMAIEFDGTTNGQAVSFGTILDGLPQKNFLVWYNVTDLSGTSTTEIFGKFTIGVASGWGLFVANNTDHLVFFQYWSGSPGALVTWTTPDGSVTTGNHLFDVSYDWASTTNDPIIKIDNVTQSLVENYPPAGSLSENVSAPLVLGAYRSDRPALAGQARTFLVYNRILSDVERADAYYGKQAIPTYRGLVLAPHLCGAAGLTSFDGATLAAGNLLTDQMQGLKGTPANSPIARGDNFLTFAGMT